MRLTVGPLPAAVYWRRRVMVLSGLLVVLLVISYSCSGSKAGVGAGADPTPSASASRKVEPKPSGTPSAEAVAPVIQLSPSAVVDPRECTDAELRVTARPERTTLQRGSDLAMTILIKNTSNRTCLRDVGFDLQELYIVQGAEKIWSSDDCSSFRGNDMRSFPPGHERSYSTVWNGRESSTCTKAVKSMPDGPVPPKGEYQLIGRVGTDHSAPVTLKLT